MFIDLFTFSSHWLFWVFSIWYFLSVHRQFQNLLCSCNKLISPLRCLLSHGSNFCCLFLLNVEWLFHFFVLWGFFLLLLGVEEISCGLLFCLFLFRKPPVCLFEFSLLNEKTFVEQSSEWSFPPLPCDFVMRSTAVSSPLNINGSLCNFSLMCFILVPVQAVEMKTPSGPYVECNLLCSFGCKHDNKLEDVMNIHWSAQGFSSPMSAYWFPSKLYLMRDEHGCRQPQWLDMFTVWCFCLKKTF